MITFQILQDIFDNFTGQNTPYTYDTLVSKTPKRNNIRSGADEVIIRTKSSGKNKFLRVLEPSVKPPLLGGDMQGGELFPDKTPYSGSARRVRVGYAMEKGELQTASSESIGAEGGSRSAHLRVTPGAGAGADAGAVAGAVTVRTGDNGSGSGLRVTGNGTSPSQNSLRSTGPRYKSSSDSFSQEFVYAATVLAVLVIFLIAWRVSKKFYASILPVDEKLEVAVTRDMRYSKYEIVSPDTYNGDAVRKEGTRRRNRSASTAGGASSATNTFLLFSPNTEQ